MSSVGSIIVWYTLLSILIFHWSACLTWSFPFVALYATRTRVNNSEAYIFKSGTYQESFSYVYLISLHMGVSNLVGSSLIELKDTFMYDKLIRCVILLFGTGYTIYVIGNFLLKKNKKKNIFQFPQTQLSFYSWLSHLPSMNSIIKRL